ncbi:MAG: tetratricopeptide repeat protein [Proteobacteria bacterium]|nr:tetratricopeptide repeat protein [Pseudomonadota bacterium]
MLTSVAPFCLLVVCIAAIYGQTLAFPFLSYDDPLHVADNPLLVTPGVSNPGRFWTQQVYHLYMPVTYTAWFALARVARAGLSPLGTYVLSPLPFHCANVLLHVWNTLWIWLLLRPFASRRLALWLGVALFALHPLQVETVAWVTGLKDVLYAAFALPALWLSARFARSGGLGTAVLATGLYATALLTKPSACALPLMVVALGMALAYPRRRVIGLAVLWGLLVLPVAWLTAGVQTGPTEAPNGLARLYVALDALAVYAKNLMWPSALTIDYGHDPMSVLRAWPALGPLLVAGLLLVVFSNKLLRRVSGWPVLLLISSLLPVLGFIPFDFQRHSTVADRYFYVSMVAACLLVVRLANKAPRWCLALGFCLAGFLSVLATRQVALWSNGERLFRHAVAINSRSAMAQQSLGSTLLNQGDLPGAEAAFRAALAVDPLQVEARYNLALVQERSGAYAAALPLYTALMKEAQMAHPEIPATAFTGDIESFEGAARMLYQLGQFTEADALLSQAAARYPERGNIFWIRGQVLERLQRFDEARGAFAEAVKLLPNAPELLRADAAFLRAHPQDAVADAASAAALAARAEVLSNASLQVWRETKK